MVIAVFLFRGSTSTNGSQTSGITTGNILFFQARGKGSQAKTKQIQYLDMSYKMHFPVDDL